MYGMRNAECNGEGKCNAECGDSEMRQRLLLQFTAARMNGVDEVKGEKRPTDRQHQHDRYHSFRRRILFDSSRRGGFKVAWVELKPPSGLRSRDGTTAGIYWSRVLLDEIKQGKGEVAWGIY